MPERKLSSSDEITCELCQRIITRFRNYACHLKNKHISYIKMVMVKYKLPADHLAVKKILIEVSKTGALNPIDSHNYRQNFNTFHFHREMKYSKVEDLLIDLVQPRQFLYDKSHPSYSIATIKNAAWNFISKQITEAMEEEYSSEECKNIWTRLRNRFTAEKLKFKKDIMKYGLNARSKVAVSFDKRMEFLDKCLGEKKVSINFSQDAAEMITDSNSDVNADIKIEPLELYEQEDAITTPESTIFLPISETDADFEIKLEKHLDAVLDSKLDSELDSEKKLEKDLDNVSECRIDSELDTEIKLEKDLDDVLECRLDSETDSANSNGSVTGKFHNKTDSAKVDNTDSEKLNKPNLLYYKRQNYGILLNRETDLKRNSSNIAPNDSIERPESGIILNGNPDLNRNSLKSTSNASLQRQDSGIILNGKLDLKRKLNIVSAKSVARSKSGIMINGKLDFQKQSLSIAPDNSVERSASGIIGINGKLDLKRKYVKIAPKYSVERSNSAIILNGKLDIKTKTVNISPDNSVKKPDSGIILNKKLNLKRKSSNIVPSNSVERPDSLILNEKQDLKRKSSNIDPNDPLDNSEKRTKLVEDDADWHFFRSLYLSFKEIKSKATRHNMKIRLLHIIGENMHS